jgi:hypothetical protein
MPSRSPRPYRARAPARSCLAAAPASHAKLCATLRLETEARLVPLGYQMRRVNTTQAQRERPPKSYRKVSARTGAILHQRKGWRKGNGFEVGRGCLTLTHHTLEYPVPVCVPASS